MAIPATLEGNWISIVGAPSVQGMISVNSKIQFGVVSSLYNGGGWAVKVGDSVMFNLDNGYEITQGGNNYILLKESDIMLVENVAP